LSAEEVRHVARLARLHLGDEQVESYRRQLSSILAHLARVDELDVTEVEPLAHPVEFTNRLAADEVGPALTTEQVLTLAPAVEDQFLAVPKVLGEGATERPSDQATEGGPHDER
jgi:aspartyl-tRNA(Asn)/glutamyl-tRNA(Gln) amidotransferase subunit C